MKNVLLDKGIILPSGAISKDKINLVAGAITQPFAEMVWVTTGGDMETINRLTDVLVTMNTPADRGQTALYGMRRVLCFKVEQRQILPLLPETYHEQTGSGAHEEKTRPCYAVGAKKSLIYRACSA